NALWEANDRWIYTLGSVFGSLPIAIFVHLLVVYPTGRIEGRLARAIVYSVYPIALLASLVPALFDPKLGNSGCHNCPSNVILVTDHPGIANAIGIVANGLGVALVFAVVFLL